MVSVEAGSKQRTSAFGAGRQALIEATITVVARAGLRNLTYRAVAKEAGVAHGLVAHHFGSRQALIEAALQHALDESADVLSAVTEDRAWIRSSITWRSWRRVSRTCRRFSTS